MIVWLWLNSRLFRIVYLVDASSGKRYNFIITHSDVTIWRFSVEERRCSLLFELDALLVLVYVWQRSAFYQPMAWRYKFKSLKFCLNNNYIITSYSSPVEFNNTECQFRNYTLPPPEEGCSYPSFFNDILTGYQKKINCNGDDILNQINFNSVHKLYFSSAFNSV